MSGKGHFYSVNNENTHSTKIKPKQTTKYKKNGLQNRPPCKALRDVSINEIMFYVSLWMREFILKGLLKVLPQLFILKWMILSIERKKS